MIMSNYNLLHFLLFIFRGHMKVVAAAAAVVVEVVVLVFVRSGVGTV